MPDDVDEDDDGIPAACHRYPACERHDDCSWPNCSVTDNRTAT